MLSASKTAFYKFERNDIFTIFEKNTTTAMTFKTILKEMRDVPSERMEELYQYVHSLNPKSKRTERLRKQILSFAGAFSDMSNKDYKSFLKQTKKTRSNLFERHVKL